jgi:hypothetical protein
VGVGEMKVTAERPDMWLNECNRSMTFTVFDSVVLLLFRFRFPPTLTYHYGQNEASIAQEITLIRTSSA